MKKTRYIPYGYTMRNGRTVISGEEAEVIREIFNSYLNGASLKAIADELTDRQMLSTTLPQKMRSGPTSTTGPSCLCGIEMVAR